MYICINKKQEGVTTMVFNDKYHTCFKAHIKSPKQQCDQSCMRFTANSEKVVITILLARICATV